MSNGIKEQTLQMNFSVEPRDVFPLPISDDLSSSRKRKRPEAATPDGLVSSERSARARKRQRNRSRRHSAFVSSLLLLNGLAVGSVVDVDGDMKRVETKSQTVLAAQSLVMQYLQTTIDSAIRRGWSRELDDEVQSETFAYDASPGNRRIWLDPGILSLPKEGVAGSTQ